MKYKGNFANSNCCTVFQTSKHNRDIKSEPIKLDTKKNEGRYLIATYQEPVALHTNHPTVSSTPLSWGSFHKPLVWPQWWSFGEVSQQRLDFSKKIIKMQIFFWFDFHRCSHGLSKIGHHFRKKSGSKIEVFKKWQ